MFKRIMMMMALAVTLASTVGAATSTQQNPLPQCNPCIPGGSGN